MNQPNWLPNLVLLEDFNGNWERYINAIYEFFEKDFIVDHPTYLNIEVKLKRCLKLQGKDATFWHLISEGKIEENRLPDLRRCERIRWPRPILENSGQPIIKVWENVRKDEKRICLWLVEFEYLVILARRTGYILLWTAYLVTRSHQKKKLIKEYEEFKKAGAARLDGTVTLSTHGR